MDEGDEGEDTTMATIIDAKVKQIANAAWAGVMFPEVGTYVVDVGGEEYAQVVQIVAGEVDDEDAGTVEAKAVYSWVAGDDNGTHERGGWYASKEEAVASAREHVEANDGRLADYCG